MSEAHVHHWKCEPPNGPEVAAACACGATRVFRPYSEKFFTDMQAHAPAQQAARHVVEGINHGASGYSYHKCRCLVCTRGWGRYQSQRRAKGREAVST